jgi:hypothetical protein
MARLADTVRLAQDALDGVTYRFMDGSKVWGNVTSVELTTKLINDYQSISTMLDQIARQLEAAEVLEYAREMAQIAESLPKARFQPKFIPTSTGWVRNTESPQ